MARKILDLLLQAFFRNRNWSIANSISSFRDGDDRDQAVTEEEVRKRLEGLGYIE